MIDYFYFINITRFHQQCAVMESFDPTGAAMLLSVPVAYSDNVLPWWSSKGKNVYGALQPGKYHISYPVIEFLSFTK